MNLKKNSVINGHLLQYWSVDGHSDQKSKWQKKIKNVNRILTKKAADHSWNHKKYLLDKQMALPKCEVVKGWKDFVNDTQAPLEN